MKIKQKSVEAFYNAINEEERLKRQKVNRIEFLTTTHYLDKYIDSESKMLDACAGEASMRSPTSIRWRMS